MQEEKNENKGITQNSLFDNPMVKQARQALTKEQKERYQEYGEMLLKRFDNHGKQMDITDNVGDVLLDIESALRSGLTPDDLEENEQQFMENIKGKDWKKLYN